MASLLLSSHIFPWIALGSDASSAMILALVRGDLSVEIKPRSKLFAKKTRCTRRMCISFVNLNFDIIRNNYG